MDLFKLKYRNWGVSERTRTQSSSEVLCASSAFSASSSAVSLCERSSPPRRGGRGDYAEKSQAKKPAPFPSPPLRFGLLNALASFRGLQYASRASNFLLWSPS